MKNRRHVHNILEQSKDFTKVKTEALGIGKCRLFVNNNLTPKLKNLGFNCRKLKRLNLIENTWSFNGVAKIKLLNGHVKKISHELDLFKEFPHFEDFSFDVDFLANTEEFEEWADYDLESDPEVMNEVR